MCRSRISAALLGAALLVLAFPASGPAADPVTFQRLSVTPAKAFVEQKDGVRISYVIAGTAAADVSIRILGEGAEVRRIDQPGMSPGEHTLEWIGLTARGKPVDDGTYRVMVGAPGTAEREAGSFELFGHYFPVRGAHGTRGPVGSFHAPRNGGRIHEGFDVTGRCGTPLAAVRAGKVIRRGYDPRLYGNFIQIRGDGEKTTYFFAHMVKPSRYKRGDHVLTGAIVGKIGLTGNAAGTPCHLHIQIEQKGRLVDPYPYLRRWDKES